MTIQRAEQGSGIAWGWVACHRAALLVATLMTAMPMAVGENADAAETNKAATYAAPSVADVAARFGEWLAQPQTVTGALPLTAAQKEQLHSGWTAEAGGKPADERLVVLMKLIGVVDPATRELITVCDSSPDASQRPKLLAQGQKLLGTIPSATPADAKSADPKTNAATWYQANRQLYFAQWLVAQNLFEEAYELLGKLDPAAVIDPASCLFLRAVCEHQLLLKAEGLATLKKLQDQTIDVPVRYTAVAALMKEDLELLDPETLDEIARKMTDVQRRLTLGRTGPKVQKKEDEIVATLDEMIKKLEDQSSSSSSSNSSGQSQQNANPAQDSQVKGSTAPGNVDRKKFSNNGAWGGLPDKQRAKAKDLISREFPAHYRQAIEEYTRKAAGRTAAPRK